MSRSWFLILFSNKRKQNSLEKGRILEVKQKIYHMRLKHLIAPGSKKVLRKKITAWGMSEKYRSQQKELQTANIGTTGAAE